MTTTDPLATLAERLYTDHQPGLAHADIDRIVAQCRADLAGTPEAALPELLERLARQRLANLASQAPTQRPTSDNASASRAR